MFSKIMNKLSCGGGINVPFILVAVIIVITITTGCSSKFICPELDKSACSQPGAYFPDENRYVLVDQSCQNIGGETYLCKVFADKYMLTMYLYTENTNRYYYGVSMTQLFYEDGSPMIYDPTEEELAEWE